MRVLLSGGRKTQNILSGIESKFSASGDEFLIVEFIDNISEIFSKGDYFDKALITAQSITRDGEIKDEMQVRQRVNNFATSMAQKAPKANFVFLSQYRDVANMIYEEILPISNDSAVVYKEPKYKATFFIELITKEAAELPKEWIYEPDMNVPDGEGMNLDEGNENAKLRNNIPDAPTDDIFGGDGDNLLNNKRVSDRLNINDGSGLNLQDGLAEIPDGSEMIPAGNSEEDFLVKTGAAPGFGGNFQGGFSQGGNNSDDEIDQSEIPTGIFDEIGDDFLNPQGSGQGNGNQGFDDMNGFGSNEYDSNGFGGDNNGFGDESNGFGDESNGFGDDENGFSDSNGFDDDTGFGNFDENGDDSGNNNGFGEGGNGFGEDGFGEDGFGIDNQQSFDQSGNLPDYTEQASGFNNGLYDTDEQQSAGEGFGEELYGGDEQGGYQSGIENDIYSQNPAGFNDSTYDNNSINNREAFGNDDEYGQNNPQFDNQTQKKGSKFGGLFKKKQGNPDYQDVSGQLNSAQPVSSWERNGQSMNTGKKKGINIEAIRQALKPFASRGDSIVVTGSGGCGTSTIAYNLANIINELGFSVLLVDMDTRGKTQSYISKTNYDSMDPDGANLMSAVNSSGGITAQEAIVKQGFHLLTMGLGTDSASVNEVLQKDKISRFANIAKSSHHFIVYDIPFETATTYLSEIVYMADSLVLVADASNWGVTKMMINVCNIESDDMQDTIFKRAQLVFNRYRNISRAFGRKIKTGADITKVTDMKIQELLGEDPGFHFEDLHIAGIINDDPEFENCWYDIVQYSDTPKGQAIFVELLENIVLMK